MIAPLNLIQINPDFSLLLEELGIDIVPIVLEDPCGKETAPIAPYLCSALSLLKFTIISTILIYNY